MTDQPSYDTPRPRALGPRVAIDPSARIYGADYVSIGSDVRIDAFTILSAGVGGINIGSHVHIAAGCYLFGSDGILIEDFVGLSSRCSVYSASDDYSGAALTGPTIPDAFRVVKRGEVVLERHAVIGSGAVILPGVTVSRHSAVGALSLVTDDVPEGIIVAGIPAKAIGVRDVARLAELERQLLSNSS